MHVYTRQVKTVGAAEKIFMVLRYVRISFDSRKSDLKLIPVL